MTHHGSADIPILKILPRMQCCVPGTADEFETLLRQTYNNGAPTYIRASLQQNESSRPITFGKLHVERQGTHGIVVAVGPTLERTLAAVEGMDLTVLYATTVVPFDAETLRRAADQAAANVVLVEPYYAGALVPEIARALRDVPARIEAIGVPRRVLEKYGPPERFDEEIGLTAAGIRETVERFFNL
jgi:transketolase